MRSDFVLKIHSSPRLQIHSTQWQVPLKGGVIGRAKECDWMLDDISRVISRQHARVEIEYEQCFWTDLGTNSTLVNGKPMPHAQRTRLNPGDVLKIGEYSIGLERVSLNWSGLDALKQELDDDPMASFLPRHDTPVSIDDLLVESVPESVPEPAPELVPEPVLESDCYSSANLLNDEPHVPVLAHRMYVGLQQADHIAPAPHPPAYDLEPVERELAELRHLLRVSVQGVMQMLQARRLFKTELGSELTTLSSKGNNPLKFSRSADEALLLLTRVQSPGYLHAQPALEQAFEDLLAHMQLSISQTQAVIDQVHRALDPQLISSELEQLQRLNQAGFNLAGLSKGLTASRKARLWDLYCERYKRLSDTWS